MRLPEITQKDFLTAGALCFLIIGICAIFTNINLWANLYISAKVSAVVMNFFNFVVSLFFYTMLKGLQPKIDALEEKEADYMIEDKFLDGGADN